MKPQASGNDSQESGSAPRAAAFVTTHWSAVLAARGGGSREAEAALAELCRTYWYPLFAYIRRRGHDPHEAEDLTQSFFERLLEKHYLRNLTPGMGRFRSFLLASLRHFLANEWHRAQTGKRGGGKQCFSLDDENAEARYQRELADNVTPETLFERGWALTVLEQVLARLRAEFAAGEKADLFDQLKAFLSAELPEGSYAAAARRTGLSEGAVKVAVHRMRRRYGALLRAQIADTVDDPGEVEAEVRHLIGVLAAQGFQ